MFFFSYRKKKAGSHIHLLTTISLFLFKKPLLIPILAVLAIMAFMDFIDFISDIAFDWYHIIVLPISIVLILVTAIIVIISKVIPLSLTGGLVHSYQTAGDFVRFSPHWRGILLEEGFDQEGNFVYLPISSTKQLTEFFRQLVIKHFVYKKLINENFALK